MSAMKKKPIEEATNVELIEHARAVMGLEVKDGTPTVHVLSKIRSAEPEIKEIFYVEQAPAQAVPVQAQPIARTNEALIAAGAEAAAAGELGTGWQFDPKVRLTIPKTEAPGGDRDVQVSVNGVLWIVRRDEWVDLPYRVYDALRSAMQTLYEQKKPEHATSRPETVARDVLSYPFQIDMTAMPSPEAIAAYRARTDAVFNP